jgi:hypothetical protein
MAAMKQSENPTAHPTVAPASFQRVFAQRPRRTAGVPEARSGFDVAAASTATQQRADGLGSSKAGEPASRSRDSAGNVWCLGENATSVRYSPSR